MVARCINTEMLNLNEIINDEPIHVVCQYHGCIAMVVNRRCSTVRGSQPDFRKTKPVRACHKN